MYMVVVSYLPCRSSLSRYRSGALWDNYFKNIEVSHMCTNVLRNVIFNVFTDDLSSTKIDSSKYF